MPASATLEHIDLRRYCESGQRLSGEWPVARMSRLIAAAGESGGSAGVAVYDVTFYRDEEARLCLQGEVRATVVLLCQRCLEPLSVALSGIFSLAGVTNLDAARDLPDSLEPLILREGTLSLPEVLEDELLLAMPHVPRHPGVCAVSWPSPSEDPLVAVPAGTNPFAVLARLKGGG